MGARRAVAKKLPVGPSSKVRVRLTLYPDRAVVERLGERWRSWACCRPGRLWFDTQEAAPG